MNDQPLHRDDHRTERVRELVWHMRSQVERTQLHADDVATYLGKLEERRRMLRGQAGPRGDDDVNEPALAEALAELDGTHEEIRMVGEEMQRRGEQLLAWEAEAAAKLRFHRRLIERAPMGFFLTDEHGMIADANEAAARMLHVSPAYLRNKPIVNFVSRRDVGNVRAFVRSVSRSEQVLENVVVFRPRRGGAVCTTEVRACALSRNDERAVGWLVREVPSRAAQTANDGSSPPSSRSDARTVEALATVSDELRAPIQTIQSAVYLLRRTLPATTDTSRASHCCESILRATQAMTRLTGDVLDAAKVEAGRLRLELAGCDLRQLTRELVATHEARAALRGIRLVAVLPTEPTMVQCDVGRLTQVIGTLLDNALKFTGVGQSKVVTVELSVHPDIARVEVRDEGSGIRAHELAHIFERHWQAPGGAKHGSGFGLWLARAISEAHGGTLTATSAFGEGTTLRLDLPLAAT